MTAIEIRTAVEEGKKVFWENENYQVIKDSKDQFLIKCSSGHCIGLTWDDNETLNGKPEDFYIKD